MIREDNNILQHYYKYILFIMEFTFLVIYFFNMIMIYFIIIIMWAGMIFTN